MAKRVEIDDHPQLPGTEDERDDKLIRAAKRYQSLHTQLKEAAAELEEAHTALLNVMHEKGIQKYRYKKLLIEIGQKERAKVKTATNEQEPAEESENGDGEE